MARLTIRCLHLDRRWPSDHDTNSAFHILSIGYRPVLSKIAMQVLQELESDMYFFKHQDDRIGLSIYQPVRWGIAGTAQIAEDVVSFQILNIVLLSRQDVRRNPATRTRFDVSSFQVGASCWAILAILMTCVWSNDFVRLSCMDSLPSKKTVRPIQHYWWAFMLKGFYRSFPNSLGKSQLPI